MNIAKLALYTGEEQPVDIYIDLNTINGFCIPFDASNTNKGNPDCVNLFIQDGAKTVLYSKKLEEYLLERFVKPAKDFKPKK